MKKITLIVIILLSLVLISCTKQNCDKKMDEIRSRYGEPEETTTYHSGDYHSESWWYWTKGKNFDFAWGQYVDGCEFSEYTFTPITKNFTETQKDSLMKTRQKSFEEFIINPKLPF